MKVIGLRAEEGEGEGTDIVAFVNALIDVFEEVLDSLHKLGRSAVVGQRSPSDMQCNAFTALSQRKRTGRWLAMSEDNNALVSDVISLAVIALVRFQTLERFHGLINAKSVEVLDHFILERE